MPIVQGSNSRNTYPAAHDDSSSPRVDDALHVEHERKGGSKDGGPQSDESQPAQSDGQRRAPNADTARNARAAASAAESVARSHQLKKAPSVGPEGNTNAVELPAVMARVKEHFDAQGKSPRVWGTGGPKVSDVWQVKTGDCAYLAVLAGVAKNDPSLIKNNVKQDSKGDVSVRLYAPNGAPVTEHVSAKSLQMDQDLASTNDGAATWVRAYEEALKQYKEQFPEVPGLGPKGNIEGIYSKTAYEVITGKKARYMTELAKDPDQAWKLLSKANQGQVVTTETLPTKTEKGAYLPNGMPGNHGYTVLGTSKDADGNKMVTLRNPWGRNLSPVEGAKLAPDGTVIMRYDQFLKISHSITAPDK